MFLKCMAENAVRLKESMDIIERWVNDEELLFQSLTNTLKIHQWQRNQLMFGED